MQGKVNQFMIINDFNDLGVILFHIYMIRLSNKSRKNFFFFHLLRVANLNRSLDSPGDR